MEQNLSNEETYAQVLKSLAEFKEHCSGSFMASSTQLKGDHILHKRNYFTELEHIIKARLNIGTEEVDLISKYEGTLKHHRNKVDEDLTKIGNNFRSICEHNLEALTQHIKNIERLQSQEDKDYKLERMKQSRLKERNKLLAEIKITNYRNAMLQELVSRGHYLKKKEKEAMRTINALMNERTGDGGSCSEKLSDYIDIFEDLRDSNFEIY
jgi:uncharacterized coiled-coil DUF342 family protein